MNRQTAPEPVAPFVRVSAAPAGAGSPADPNATGERIRESLGQDCVGVAVALLREMLAVNQGVFLARVPRAERRVLVAQLSAAAVFVTTFTDVFGFLIFLAAGGFLVRALG